MKAPYVGWIKEGIISSKLLVKSLAIILHNVLHKLMGRL